MAENLRSRTSRVVKAIPVEQGEDKSFSNYEEKPQLYAVILEADNLYCESNGIPNHRIPSVLHLLADLISGLRINELTITVTKSKVD